MFQWVHLNRHALLGGCILMGVFQWVCLNRHALLGGCILIGECVLMDGILMGQWFKNVIHCNLR